MTFASLRNFSSSYIDLYKKEAMTQTNEINIILLGKTACGKSSLLNILLGLADSPVESAPSSLPDKCIFMIKRKFNSGIKYSSVHSDAISPGTNLTMDTSQQKSTRLTHHSHILHAHKDKLYGIEEILFTDSAGGQQKLHDTFLHNRVVLPQTMICDFLTKVTELVKYRHKLRNCPDKGVVVESDLVTFRDYGLLSLELLSKFPKHYKEGLFTQHDLLQLLLSVGAIAVIRDSVYLMPALLCYLDSEQVSKYVEQGTSVIIIFRPTQVSIASGLSCCQVAHQLSSTNSSPWKVCIGSDKPALSPLCDGSTMTEVDKMSSTVHCVDIAVCEKIKWKNIIQEVTFKCIVKDATKLESCSLLANGQPPSADDQSPSPDDLPPSPDDQRPSPDDQPPSPDDQPPSPDDQPPSPDDQPPSADDQPLLANGLPPSADDQSSSTDNLSPLSENYISAEEDFSILVGVQHKSTHDAVKSDASMRHSAEVETSGEYSTPIVALPSFTEQTSTDKVDVDKYPLHTAVKEGHIEQIRQLIEQGANLNEFDKNGNTPLMLAVMQRHLDIVKILLENNMDMINADVTAKHMISHMMALDIATRNRDKGTIILLVDGLKKQKEKSSEFYYVHVANGNQQDPFVAVLQSTTFNTPMPRTSLYRSGIGSRALPSSASHSFPIKASDDGSYFSLEQRKKAKQRNKDLQIRRQDLLQLKSKQEKGKEKDIKVEMQAQCQKAKDLKRKMELFSNEAKQTSQRLSADNYQLREELRQMAHHHELTRKGIEGKARQLKLKISSASVRGRAMQRAMEDLGKMGQKNLKTIPFKLDHHWPHLKQTVEFKSFVHVIVIGLPSLGKSHILKNLFSNEDNQTQVINEEDLSVREAILTSDGHSWKWMQVSKTEASALVVGAGISQTYAKEGLTPDFIVPVDSRKDSVSRIVKEKATQLNNFTDIKGLSFINVWDIEANRDLLPLLLPRSKRLVVLSVVGLDSDAGDMHSHMHEGKHGQEVLREPYSKLDYLMAPPSIARCHTVVVGTHDGKLSRDRLRARQRRVERLVRANAEEMGIGKMLYPKCIAVDTSNQGDVVKIRNVLEKVVINSCEHNVEVPLAWVCLHDDLLRECDWYITKETLWKSAKQLGITNQQDVEKWLELYSECGSIIYLDELRDYIILKPSTFFSKVQKLYAEAKKAGHGRIHELAKQLWRKEDCGSEFLLKIFEYLGLMVKIDDISAGNSSSGKVIRYYMPSLCLESPPIAEELSSLFVVLPRASLSSTHLARFVKFIKVLHSSKGIKYVDNEKNQYWNQLHLQLYREPQLANVNICIVDNHLEVKVTCAPQGKDGVQLLRKACSVFKTVIIDFFQHIGKDSYELSLLCPPSVQSGMPHFISFHPLDKEDPSKRGMLFCGQCRRDVGIEDSALEWLRADYEGPKLSALKPQEIISIDLMVKLSHDLSTITPQQMEALGCALGCSNANTEMMMKCSSMQECILSLLQMWMRNYHLPTKERLAQALKKSGCLDMTIRLTAPNVSSLLSPEELTEISRQVSEFNNMLRNEDSETNWSNNVLDLWSKRKLSSRNGFITALIRCDFIHEFVLLLLLKNNAFWMLK